MTQKEFWAALEGTRFRITTGAIRHKTNDLCPICALCLKLKRKKFNNCQWEKAAELLGLKEDFAFKIVEAADSYISPLRKKLEKVLGLS